MEELQPKSHTPNLKTLQYNNVSASNSEGWWRFLINLGLHFCKWTWRFSQDYWCPQC